MTDHPAPTPETAFTQGPDAPQATVETEEVVIDFNFQHFRREHGDITVILTWNFNDDNPDAVLLLVPTYAPDAGENLNICVIARNDAWKWSRTHNSDRQMVGYHGFGKPPSSDEWQQMNAIYYCMQLNLAGDLSLTS